MPTLETDRFIRLSPQTKRDDINVTTLTKNTYNHFTAYGLPVNSKTSDNRHLSGALIARTFPIHIKFNRDSPTSPRHPVFELDAMRPVLLQERSTE